MWSMMNQTGDTATIFEIYTTPGKNSTATNIDLAEDDWSFFPNEKEVTLMPFFGYQVVGTRNEENDHDGQTIYTKVVTLIELPYQHTLQIRTMKYDCTIWLHDSNISL